MLMAIKAILFDLDDTLYPYGPVHKKALKASWHTLRSIVPMTYKRFVQLYRSSREEIHRELAGTASAHNRTLYFQRMMEKAEGTIEPSLILKLDEVYWQTSLREMQLRPGVVDFLKYCRKNGIKTAVVSDLTTHIQLRKLMRLRISRYIDVLVTSEEAGSEKPHSIMFLLALNKLGVAPEDALMVGDNTVADIEGANFVRIRTVLLSKDLKQERIKEDYRKPDYRIRKIAELYDVMDKENLRQVTEEGYTKFTCRFRKSKALSHSVIKELDLYRQKLYDRSLIGAYSNKVGYGNISIRKDGNLIITGSTTGNHAHLSAKHYSKVTSFDIERNQVQCTGAIPASSETMTHAALYECSREIGAVIHVHSLEMWKKYKGRLPTTSESAAYGTPEIAREVQRLYRQTSFSERKVAVLGGHKEGLVAFGKNLEDAYQALISYA